MPDCNTLQDHARVQVRLGRHVLEPGADKGVAAMLTCASWILQQLPHKVVQRQRAELVRTLSHSKLGRYGAMRPGAVDQDLRRRLTADRDSCKRRVPVEAFLRQGRQPV
jgi:hypothetical protein